MSFARKRGRIELKADGPPGSFRAIFSTFDVIDHDNDVTLPGAFPEGKEVPVSAYGHRSWDGALPIGRGVVHQDSERAWLDGQFFMDSEGGRETHAVLKGLGELAEFSYGYDVIDSELGQFDGQDVRFLNKADVLEVSPVLYGAGIDTGLMAIKATKQAIAVHHTDTTDVAWDGSAAEAAIPDDATPAVLRKHYAWVDPDGESDAGREPPELRSKGLPFSDEALAALAAVLAFTIRAKALADLRAADERPLSNKSKAHIAELLSALDQLAELRPALEALVAPTEPVRPATRGRALEAAARAAALRGEELRGAPY